jgi:hypothetical protein
MATADESPVELPVTDTFTFGQVLVRPMSGGRFRLSHRDDSDPVDTLEIFGNPDDALAIARTDDYGNYRSLKTAPNLRHRWQLEISTVEDLRRALDLFYPGRLAILTTKAAHQLSCTHLRDTLSRQTGMYRVAGKISDQQLDELIGDFCRSNGRCLRTILWKRDQTGALPSTKLPREKYDQGHDQALSNGATVRQSVNLPLLCQEACNLLVAECRKIVKAGDEHS